MRVAKTNIRVEELTVELRKKIMAGIRELIPLGTNHHSKMQDYPQVLVAPSEKFEVVRMTYATLPYQIGTLGGGNHFIELQADEEGFVYVMIHSGSRNLGKRVGDHYNRKATELNAKWHSSVTREVDLAFLPFNTPEGDSYYSEMRYCVDFARYSRKMMVERALSAIADVLPKMELIQIHGSGTSILDVPHNYADVEHHFGRNVMVHRKGATKAATGEYGIIPGSQGTSSYIVVGKGEMMSFHSCSHGAGRKMGRNDARRTLDLQTEIDRLDSQGIVHSVRHQADLDEAAGAYKDIDVVMANQADLVEIAVKLRPLAVIKAEETPRKKRKDKSNEIKEAE